MTKGRHKYRVWHKPTKQMFDVVSFCERLVKVEIKQESLKSPMSECELMQCTGMRDKNNQLAYEGDIIYCEDLKMHLIISWAEDDLQYKCLVPNADYTNLLCVPPSLARIFCCENHYPKKENTCVIVGNIYQNPELLEDNK